MNEESKSPLERRYEEFKKKKNLKEVESIQKDELPKKTARQFLNEQRYLIWNYRVVKEKLFVSPVHDYEDNYRIVEVFYDENGNIDSWADSTDTILSWGTYEDLKSAAELVLKAFEKPVLTVNGETLVDQN